MSTTKAAKPKATESKKESIVAKKIGVNFIATIDGKKYSKKVSDKDSTTLTNKINLFNKKPSSDLKKTIIKLLAPEATKEAKKKEDLTTKSKGLKKLAKKTVKKVKVVETERKSILDELETLLKEDETAIPKLEALIAKFKKHEEVAPIAQYTKNPSRGEVYRNGRTVTIYTAEDGREVDSRGYLVNNN